MQYKRSSRVGEELKREISDIIQNNLKDPRLGFVTVTAVEVSDDLRQAKVFYTVFGQNREKKGSQIALNRAAGFIQQEIGKRIRLKFIPQLSFHYDSSVEYGARIDELLNQIRQKEQKTTDEDQN